MRTFGVLGALVMVSGLAAIAAWATEPPADPPPGQRNPQSPPASERTPPPQAGRVFSVGTPPVARAPVPVPSGPVVRAETLEGGILVEDLVVGDGYEVQPGGVVVALYHGTLRADPATVFDSAFDRGEPVSFPLANVIPGWQRGVPGMKVGGVRRLTIPAALAYGERSPNPDIPPNSDLVFVIQLLDALQTEDLVVGSGEPTVANPFVAVTAFRITDLEGRVLEERPATNPYIWIPGEFQPVIFGLEGMKPGGKRRIRVPAELNIQSPQVPTTRPQNVPIIMEVELLSARNLGGLRQR